VGGLVKRRLAFAFGSMLVLSCRPGVRSHDAAVAGDPGPPAAPVVATLTPHGAVAGDDRLGGAATLPIDIVEHGPEGEGWGGGWVTLRFNQPMLDSALPRFTFDPPLHGDARWTDAYRVTYYVSANVTSARAYSLKVEGEVESVSGERKAVNLAWTVTTPRPSVEVYPQYDRGRWQSDHGERSWHTGFDVRVTEPVTPAALRKALKVTATAKGDASARPVAVAYTLERTTKGPHWDASTDWAIHPRGRWPLGSTIRAHVGKTLVTKAGPLPVVNEASASLDTTPGVSATLDCADEFDGGCGPSYFDVTFSHPIKERDVRKISVTPRPKGLKIQPSWAYDGAITSATISGELVVGKRYTVHVDKSLRDIGGHPIAGARSFERAIVPPSPTLELSSHEAILSATQPPVIGIETRYLEDITIERAVLDDETLALLLFANHDDRKLPKGTEVARRTMPLAPKGAYAWTSTGIDLTKEFKRAHGGVFLRVKPGKLLASAGGRTKPKPQSALYQVTDLGAFVGVSPAMSFVRVSQLSTGAPVQGAHVTIYEVEGGKARERMRKGPSDAEGIIRLPPVAKLPTNAIAVVNTDDDRFALRVGDTSPIHRDWHGASTDGGDRLLSAIVTDRPLYKAGEKVRVMGWAAKSTSLTASTLAPAGRPMVKVEIVDNRDRVVAHRTVRVKEYGKYWATLRLPEHAGLGGYTARAKIDEQEFSSRFEVRDFRTPSFDVRAAVAAGDLRHGETARVSANASYLHGMAMPIAEARQHTTCRRRAFTPLTHTDWTMADIEDTGYSWSLGAAELELDAGAKTGHLGFDVETNTLPVGTGYGCHVELALQDATHEEMGADVSFNVHPSRYLLLSPMPWSVDAGSKIAIDVQATDHDGKRVAGGSVTLKLSRRWYDKGKDREETVATCRRSVSSDKPTRCTFTPKELGSYEVVLSGKVDGARVVAQRSFHVWQRASKPGPRSTKPHDLEIERNVNKAGVGEEVVLSFAAPEAEASGVLAHMHGGLRKLESFRMKDHRARKTITVKDEWIPSMRFAAFVTTPGSPQSLPAIRQAYADITVPHDSRRLEVGIASPESVGPGDDVSIDVDVRDAKGLPAAAHVTVWAVDEAILILKDFTFPDFVAEFAIDRGSESRFGDDFDFLRWPYVERGDPWEGESIGLGSVGTGGGGGGTGAGYGGLGMRGDPPVRRKLEATPIFIADAYTGDDGRATVKGTMPENLTTFRVMAIASAQLPGAKAIGRFGRGESRTRVTTDLAVRPVLPRVMRPGDVAEIAALVDNLAGTKGRVTVDVALKDNDAVVRLVGKSSKHADATAQLRIPFEIEALRPGKVKVIVSVQLQPQGGGEPLQDAMELELPVTFERTMMKRVAHYGSAEKRNEALAVAVQQPEEAAPGSLDVEVSMHTSLLGGYKDNVDDLVEYPYGCVEQTSTRLVPLLALADLGKTYPLGIENADAYVKEAFGRLETMQTSEGGFGYWPGAEETHFYATAYATWVLGMAKAAGHDVPADLLSKPRQYLADRLSVWKDRDVPTSHDDVRMAMALQAVAGSPHDVSKAVSRLYGHADTLPIFAQTLLLMAMHEIDPSDDRVDALLRKLLARVDEREAFARTRAPSVTYTQFFDSPIRTDAMMLLALTKVAPEHALVEKFARGLSRARDAGQLQNTQENAYALLAMAAYAGLREVEEPDMFARAWVGPALVEQTSFEGRTFAVHDAEANVPSTGDATKVTLAKEGKGRLYYRVGMKWVPASMPRKPFAQGIAIERELVADGRESRKIIAGSLATIELDVSVDTQQDYVVIEVPLPAGLEAVDTSIGKGAGARVGRGGGGWWVDHKELHGDRVLLFVDHLPPGHHQIAIPLRATTPGVYRMPPARAESMYYPEIFGYTEGDEIRVVSPL
jgi:uncharacterized protein YfaS (alpha-2-macroglobulin family)